MKGMLKRKWAIPVAALVLSLSIGSVAFAAAASSSTDTTAAEDTQTTAASGSSGSSSSTQDQKAPDSGKGGEQRADETLQTGDILSKLTAAALAKVPGGKVVRVETDADGNAKYEVHMTKADGTPTTVYFDASLNYVKTVDGDGGGHRAHDKDADDATNTSGTSGSSSTTNSSSTGA